MSLIGTERERERERRERERREREKADYSRFRYVTNAVRLTVPRESRFGRFTWT